MPTQKGGADVSSPAQGTPSTRRAYHSTARLSQAAANRQRIVAAGRALFARQGYAGTTLEAIAAAAGVSVKTVVAVYGSKRGVLAEALNPAAFGGPFEEAIAELRREPEPARRLALVAALTCQVYTRFTTEFELLRGAPLVAPELAEIAELVEQRRRSQQERLVAFLHERGALRPGLELAQAVDEVWALSDFDLYYLLVVRQGWPAQRYNDWLAELLAQRLLAL